MNIWIDLANSPHVVFFKPLIARMQAAGHHVILTMRDFAQTVPLAREYSLAACEIGAHGGASMCAKGKNLAARTISLARFARNRSIDIAVSHNSYTQILAGRIIGARVVTIMDYEGQPANHLAFRCAHKVIVPRAFPDTALRKFGAGKAKVHKYHGFKEQLYLSDFSPDSSFGEAFKQSCGIAADTDLSTKTIVVVRTPATMAVYHQFQNPLFNALLAHLHDRPDVLTVLSARTREQEAEIKATYPKLCVPQHPLEGRNLVFLADAVISAGGTMNREAAILGTPAYSVFAGALPAVDRQLIETGRMFHIDSEAQITSLTLTKKNQGNAMCAAALVDEILDQILSVA